MFLLNKLSLILITVFLLSNCSNKTNINNQVKSSILVASTQDNIGFQTYQVRSGDNIVAIAKNFKISFQDLITINNFSSNELIKPGQIIQIPTTKEKLVNYPLPIKLIYPVKGKILAKFGKQANGKFNDCLYIKADNQPIKAAASGKIEYIGNKINKIGNIIIIKHSNNYYTTYSDFSKILIKLSEQVSKGQVIGITGNSPLCFSLRENSKSIDPIKFITLSNKRINKKNAK